MKTLYLKVSSFAAFFAAILLSTALLGAEWYSWTGLGGDTYWSTPANWSGNRAPDGEITNVLRLDGAPDGTVFTNDVTGAAGLIYFYDSCDNYTITGQRFTFTSIAQSTTSAFTGHYGRLHTFDLPLSAQSTTVQIVPQAETTFRFLQPLTMAEGLTGNHRLWLSGAGTNVFEAGIGYTYYTSSEDSRLLFDGGHHVFHGDLNVPWFEARSNAYLAFSNANVTVSYGNTFLQDCTVDIWNGTFGSTGGTIFLAQKPAARPVLNIREGGVFDVGSWRPGSDGHATVNVYDGGQIWQRYSAEHTGCYGQLGSLELHLYGGLLANGYGLLGDWAFTMGYTQKTTAPVGTNLLHLAGGELRIASIRLAKNSSIPTVWPSLILLDGGTIRAGTDKTSGFFTASSPATLSENDLIINATANGLVFDTDGHDVTWNYPIHDAATVPAALVKKGGGTLTLDAAFSTAGAVAVKCGLLKTTSAGYLANAALTLEKGGVFAFGSAASDVFAAGAVDFAGGTLELVLASGASQKVTATAVSGTQANFRLVDSTGAAFVTPGSYTVLSGSGVDAAFAAKCRVPGGAANRVYTFAAEAGDLVLTIAEGTNPDMTAASWNVDADGAWSVASNWSGEEVPDSTGVAVTFGSAASAARAIDVDQDAEVKSLAFANASAYTLDGTGTLTFAENATVSATAGAHSIRSKVVAPKGLTLSTTGGSSVSFADVAGEVKLPSGAALNLDDDAQIDKLQLSGGTVTYTGADDATFVSDMAIDASSVIKLGAGAGSLTLAGSLAYPSQPNVGKADQLYQCRVQSTADSEIVFAGPGWRSLQGVAGVTTLCPYLWLDGGNFRFASDLRMAIASGYYYALRLGTSGSGRPNTLLTIEDGAQLSTGDIQLTPDNYSTLVVTQGVARVKVTSSHSQARNDFVTFNGNGSAYWYVNGGSFDANVAAQWFDVRGGAKVVFDVLNGGSAALPRVSFAYVKGVGYGGAANVTYRVSEGELSINQTMLVRGATRIGTSSRILAAGSGIGTKKAVLATVPTFEEKTYADDLQAPPPGAGVYLDGATLKTLGTGSYTETATLSDFFGGFNTVMVGPGGATVDTDGKDVTIKQPILAAGDCGGLVKTGVGTLTLAATNAVMGAVKVEQGTLKARFGKALQTSLAANPLAAWNFDGEDPYRDITGRGYDLAQLYPDAPVVFTNENALAGKSALWTNSTSVASALKVSTINNLPYAYHTISFWVRLATAGNAGLVSTRWQSDATPNGFCMLYRGDNGKRYIQIERSGYNFPSGDGHDLLPLGEWHMVTSTYDNGACCCYFDGELVATGTRSFNLFESAGRTLTFGRNHRSGEQMSKGGMMDDLAIWGRVLTAKEIKTMYESAHRKPVSGVEVAAEATLDLDGDTLTTPELAGAGTVANGAVTVTEKLAPTAETLTVGVLALGEDGTVDLGVEGTVRYRSRDRVTLAHFDTLSAESEANFRHWAVVNTGADPVRGEFKLGVDRTANTLYAEFVGKGLVLIVR